MVGCQLKSCFTQNGKICQLCIKMQCQTWHFFFKSLLCPEPLPCYTSFTQDHLSSGVRTIQYQAISCRTEHGTLQSISPFFIFSSARSSLCCDAQRQTSAKKKRENVGMWDLRKVINCCLVLDLLVLNSIESIEKLKK